MLWHAGMPLRALWLGSPWRRPGGRPPSPREDVSEVPVGRGAVPKTGQKNSLPREDATEVSVGRVAVPKDGQKNASPRGDGTEPLVGRVTSNLQSLVVPRAGAKVLVAIVYSNNE